MSGLAGILAGHLPPGVYRWHAAVDIDEVTHAVEDAGWMFGYVDGWRARTRAEFLDAIAASLAFPAYYGRNLDALNDCLRDLPGPAVLLWDGWGTLARSDERTFAAVVRILGDHTDTLTTLLRGEGPDLDLPALG